MAAMIWLLVYCCAYLLIYHELDRWFPALARRDTAAVLAYAVVAVAGDRWPDKPTLGVVGAWTAWDHYQQELVLSLRRRPATVRAYRYAIQDWAAALAGWGKRWEQANPRLLGRYLDRPTHGRNGRAGRPLSPNSRAWYSTVILTFYAWAAEAGLLRRNPLAGVHPEHRSDTLARALDLADVDSLLNAVTPDPRTHLAVALAYYGFLRVGEIARLRIEDVDLRAAVMVVDGKGGHIDPVPVHPDLQEILRGELARRARRGRSTRAGPWVEHALHPGRHLTPGTVSRMISRPMHALGLADSGHALRHTAATELLAALDGNVYPVSKALRHRKLASTEVYARLRDPQLARAIARLPRPQAGPG